VESLHELERWHPAGEIVEPQYAGAPGIGRLTVPKFKARNFI